VEGITIDSRAFTPGQAFVAIRGTRLDGHAFLDEVARRQAACLIVSEAPSAALLASGPAVIRVQNTTLALGRLARYHRRRFAIPVIGVTGSCGKTTTKELIAHVMGGGTPQVLKTTGTQNNHIGAPLTLLRLDPSHRLAVVEMGSNHPGEIAYLASLVEPTTAVITNVGPVHLEFLGSIMGVMQEKLSVLKALRSEGTAVLPGDQLDVCLEAPAYVPPGTRTVTFGTTERCDIQAVDVQRSAQGMVARLRDQVAQWAIPLVGYHNVENVLAATACAWSFGLPLSVIKERVTSFEPVPLRSEVVRCGGVTILNDCYNANPLSVARALETLCGLSVRRTVAIVGDMLELGTYAPSAHQAIGRLASQLGIDAVLAVGEYADHVALGVHEMRPDGVRTFRTVQDLLPGLPALLQDGDGLLVKGSRKLNLEQVAAFLKQQWSGV
jgi:UDP-N-acetylmuramoyl-tripeptide--D-alanyl-D-alanine ligase